MWLNSGSRSHYVAMLAAALGVLFLFTLITSMGHPFDPHPVTATAASASASQSDSAAFDLHSALRQVVPVSASSLTSLSVTVLYQRTNRSLQSAVQAWPQLHAAIHNTDHADHVDNTEEKGLVMLFHGCSHTAADWFELPEDRRIVRLLLASGYSVAAFLSADRHTGCWDSKWPLTRGGSNVDVGRVIAGLQALVEAEYGQQQRYPTLFTLGASSGGTFTTIVSRALPVMAQVPMISPGSEPALLTPSTRPLTAASTQPAVSSFSASALSSADRLYPVPPTLFVYMPRDEDWASAARIQSVRERMLAAGKRLGFRIGRDESVQQLALEPLAITPTFLSSRVDGISEEQSRSFHSLCQSERFIDSSGLLLDRPRHSGMVDFLMEKLSWPEQLHSAVREEMNLAYGQHELTSERMDEVVQWMERQRTGRAR